MPVRPLQLRRDFSAAPTIGASRLAVTLPSLMLISAAVFAEAPQEVEEPPGLSVEEQQQELQKLLAIASASRAPVKDFDAEVTVVERPFIGDPAAPLAIIELSDFQCPFSRKHALELMPALIADWVDGGRVRYLFLDYPAEARHPFARDAAEASRCAAEQGRYWEFRQQLFENYKALQPVFLVEHAKAAGLASETFSDCVASERQAAEVAEDLSLAIELGIRGTPTFLLGVPTRAGESVRVLRRIDGVQNLAVFSRVLGELEDELKGEATRKPH